MEGQYVIEKLRNYKKFFIENYLEDEQKNKALNLLQNEWNLDAIHYNEFLNSSIEIVSEYFELKIMELEKSIFSTDKEKIYKAIINCRISNIFLCQIKEDYLMDVLEEAVKSQFDIKEINHVSLNFEKGKLFLKLVI